MIGKTARGSSYAGAHRPFGLEVSFASIVTIVLGGALLWAAFRAILTTRSVKYLVTYVVMGLLATGFLALRGKHGFLLTCTGLSVPLYIGVLVVDRGVTLTVTSTLLTILLLAVTGFAIGSIGKPNLIFEPAVSGAAALFLCACILSLTNTADRTATLVALSQEVEMVLIFLVLVNSIRERAHLLSFLRGVYWGFAIECVIYVIQNILGFSFDIVGNTRWVGSTDLESGYIGSQRGTFAGNPATAALYFSVWTLLLTGVHLSGRRLPVGLKTLPAMAMGVGCLALAAKRAPWVGFAMGIVVIMLLLRLHSAAGLRRFGRILAILGVASLFLLPVILLRAGADHQSAYEERKNLTRIAWEMYHAHPVFGIGLGNYDAVKRDYLPEGWIGWIYTVHNRYLLILAETGLVGEVCLLVLYALVLVVAYRGIRKIAEPYRPIQISIVAALIAIYWEMNWDIFDGRTQGYLLWFTAALAVILPRVLARDEVPHSP